MSQPIQNARIEQLVQNRVQPQQRPVGKGPDFDAVLTDKLKLSGHAKTRLQSRDIQLEAAAWDRVMQGVEKAQQKGAKESLVLVDDVALIVSVKNRTVITAVDREGLKENVFTNIDSAVIV